MTDAATVYLTVVTRRKYAPSGDTTAIMPAAGLARHRKLARMHACRHVSSPRRATGRE